MKRQRHSSAPTRRAPCAGNRPGALSWRAAATAAPTRRAAGAGRRGKKAGTSRQSEHVPGVPHADQPRAAGRPRAAPRLRGAAAEPNVHAADEPARRGRVRCVAARAWADGAGAAGAAARPRDGDCARGGRPGGLLQRLPVHDPRIQALQQPGQRSLVRLFAGALVTPHASERREWPQYYADDFDQTVERFTLAELLRSTRRRSRRRSTRFAATSRTASTGGPTFCV